MLTPTLIPLRWFDLRRRRKGFVCNCQGEPQRLQPLRAQYPLWAWYIFRRTNAQPEPAAYGDRGCSLAFRSKAHSFCGGLRGLALGDPGLPQESEPSETGGRGDQVRDQGDPCVAGRAGNCRPSAFFLPERGLVPALLSHPKVACYPEQALTRAT